MEPPEPDAYGRVSHPERFSLVVEAAEEMIGQLTEHYDVRRLSGVASTDFPDWNRGGNPTVRLVPSEGVPLSFRFTDFPGVIIRFGDGDQRAFPACGCDACDDRPEDVVVRLRQAVEAVVAGTFEEVRITRPLRRSFQGRPSHSLLRKRLTRARIRQRKVNRWPPWPEKQPTD